MLQRSPYRIDIQDFIFRANPEYQLILYDRLAKSEQTALIDLLNDKDFYGILRSKNNQSLAIKSVNFDTALLYLSLLEEGRLPHYIYREHTINHKDTIIKLVCDSILQIKVNDVYLDGPQAYQFIYDDLSDQISSTYLGQLSIEALRYAQNLHIQDLNKLSARIYFYNRIPVSDTWLQALPTKEAVADFLGVNSFSSKVLAAWSQSTTSSDDWIYWFKTNYRGKKSQDSYTYKLYISCIPGDIPAIFPLVVNTLSQSKAYSFKVGGNAYGLLRPDKFVVYFHALDHLQSTATILLTQLVAAAVHGTPFTAEIGLSGLLSWGVDPPKNTQLLSWQERESWRLWLTNRLARFLIDIDDPTALSMEPWMYALNRLDKENIDTTTWTPRAQYFNQ